MPYPQHVSHLHAFYVEAFSWHYANDGNLVYEVGPTCIQDDVGDSQREHEDVFVENASPFLMKYVNGTSFSNWWLSANSFSLLFDVTEEKQNHFSRGKEITVVASILMKFRHLELMADGLGMLKDTRI